MKKRFKCQTTVPIPMKIICYVDVTVTVDKKTSKKPKKLQKIFKKKFKDWARHKGDQTGVEIAPLEEWINSYENNLDIENNFKRPKKDVKVALRMLKEDFAAGPRINIREMDASDEV